MAQLKLKGYVLLESMFAMVIIMTCFSISLSVLNSMTDNQRNYLVIKAEIALKSEAARCKTEGLLYDEDIQSEGFVIERRIISSEQNRHLATLNLRAVNPKGKVISEYYEFIFIR